MALIKLFQTKVKTRGHYTVKRVYLACIDWRFDEVTDQIREHFGEKIDEPVDVIAIPGGIKKLTRPRSEEALEDLFHDLRITFGHRPEEFVPILHRGCAALGDDFPSDPEAELKAGKATLERFLAQMSYPARVRPVFKDWHETYEVI